MATIVFLIAIVFLYSLHQRVKRIEDRLGIDIKPSVAPPLEASTTTFDLSRSSKIPRKHLETGPYFTTSYWLTSDGLLKVGAVLVLLGIAWFVRYAFAENWIGPIGRITLGLAFGGLLMLFAEKVSQKHLHRGTVVMSLGATTILLTFYAARLVYGFFTPVSALILMFLTLVYMATSAVVRKDQARCLLSVLGAAMVPFLTAGSGSSPAILLSYLVVVILATLWVVSITGWRRLTLLVSLIFALYSLVIGFDSLPLADFGPLKVLTLLISLLLFGSNLIIHLRSRLSTEKIKEILSLAVTTFVTIYWINSLVSDDAKSLVASFIAACLFAAAYTMFEIRHSRLLIFEYTLLALIMLAAAANFALEGPVLQTAFICLVAAAAFLAQTILHNPRTGQALALLLIPFAVLNISVVNSHSRYLITNTDPYLLLSLISGITIYLGLYWYKRHRNLDNSSVSNISAAYSIGGYFLALFTFWKFLEFFLPANIDIAHGISLVTFTLLGLAGYFWGRNTNHTKTHFTSLAVLVVVIARLLLVEVWDMNLVERVIVFLLIGGLLMVTGLKRRDVPESLRS